MHITSGFSPASGEMLDTTGLNLYGDSGEQCATTFMAVDHTVPESSHTVEIEYVFETEEVKTDTQDAKVSKPEERKKDRPPKLLKAIEKMAVDETESDLTNLTWLQNITNIMSVTEFPIRPMSPSPQVKPLHQPNTRLQKFNQTISKCQKDFLENRNQYRSNGDKKPPYSYSTLICLAMKNNDNKMTLSAIYSWIRENFKYFRTADITWQNSIRHNLSLNKVFVKMARSKHEPGKGGFWKLDLAHLEGAKRISNRPSKKKKPEKPIQPSEEQTAVANIPTNIPELDSRAVTLHLPELSLNSTFEIDNNIGANVIVEPNVPPPLMAEDDLSTLLLNPPEWDDLQLDMLDNYLDTCFK